MASCSVKSSFWQALKMVRAPKTNENVKNDNRFIQLKFVFGLETKIIHLNKDRKTQTMCLLKNLDDRSFEI